MWFFRLTSGESAEPKFQIPLRLLIKKRLRKEALFLVAMKNYFAFFMSWTIRESWERSTTSTKGSVLVLLLPTTKMVGVC